MSVINTMLQDLEQRGGKRDLSKEEILQGLSSASAGMMRRGGISPYMISLISVLTVCAMITLAYLYSPFRLVTAHTEEQAKPIAVVAQPDTRPDAAVATVAAPGITAGVKVDAADAEAVNPIAEKRRLVKAESAPAPRQQPEEAVSARRAQNTAVSAAPIASNKAASAGKHEAVIPAKTGTANRVETVAQAADVQAGPLPQENGNEDAISKTQREPSDSAKSANAYAVAMSLFSEGRTDESRLQLKQALGHDPSNSKASQLLAAIYLGDDRPELAADTLDKCLKLRPIDQDLLRLYLQVQVQMKNYAQAITIMQRRIRVNSPDDIAYLAGLYQKIDDHLGAAKLYAQALKMKPSNSVWWMGQGISFEALGKSEEAMKSYQQSISSGRLNTQLAEYVLGRIASIEKSARDPVS